MEWRLENGTCKGNLPLNTCAFIPLDSESESSSFLIKSYFPAHTACKCLRTVGCPDPQSSIISSIPHFHFHSPFIPGPNKGPWKCISAGNRQQQSKERIWLPEKIRCWDFRSTGASCCWLAADKLQQSMQGSWEYVNFWLPLLVGHEICGLQMWHYCLAAVLISTRFVSLTSFKCLNLFGISYFLIFSIRTNFDFPNWFIVLPWLK